MRTERSTCSLQIRRIRRAEPRLWLSQRNLLAEVRSRPPRPSGSGPLPASRNQKKRKSKFEKRKRRARLVLLLTLLVAKRKPRFAAGTRFLPAAFFISGF